MKKSITLASATLATLIITASAAAPVFAATGSQNATTWNSDTTVSFTAPDPTTPPPDITDPETGEPTDPQIPGVPGEFAIDYVSNLDFGNHVISAQDQTYYAATDSNTGGANFLTMHDLRSTWSGWNISVQQAGVLTATDGSGAQLTGATVTYDKGTAVWNGSGASPAGINPIASSSFTVNNAAQTIMSADTNKGMGQWSAMYGTKADYGMSSPISLYVPGNTPKKATAYHTSFIWTLGDTPNATTPAP